MTLTGRQLRDARYEVGLELSDLATRSGMDRQREGFGYPARGVFSPRS